jgi:hypothetical protein
MADGDVRKGFARSEVRLVARGDARVLVSRLVAQRGLILVLSVLALLALVVPALDLLRLDTVLLRCSREEAACTVAREEAGTRTIPLSSIVRFAVRHPRKQAPDLLAQTGSGELVLVHRWPYAELRTHADALNALLRGDGPGAWAFVYPRSLQALREDLPIFGTLFAVLVFLVVTQLGWRTRLERRARRVVRRKPLSRSVRPLGAFRAVVVRSMAEAYPGRRAAQSSEMYAVLEAHHQIALVEAGGAAWPITRFVTCPRDEVEARAAEVAAYLDLPVARPPEVLATVRPPAKPPAA